MNSPQLLRFDMQKDTFYRVNKETGSQVRSYVNGENLPVFQPSVTGLAFKRQVTLQQRKIVHDPNFYSMKHSPRSRSKSPPSKSESLKKSRPSKTIDLYDPKRDALLTNSKLFQTITSASKSRMTTSRFKVPEEGSTMNQTYLTEGQEKSKRFQELSKQFSHLYEEKVRQNHSPKKDLNGAVDVKKNYETLCLTKSNFYVDHHRNQNARNSEPKSPRVGKELSLPQRFTVQQQYLKDKTLFFKFHPEMRVKQNPKLIEKEKDRKKNLIQLQKLTIEMNNRKTKSFLY